MEHIIAVKDVTKIFEVNTEYDNLWKRLLRNNKKSVCAVNNVSLNIEKGSVVALLGKNGAGKTTLIKMLSGIVMPTSGSIVAVGMNPYKDRYKYSYRIGVILGQKSLLWHNIPARESLNLYRSIYDIDKECYIKRVEFFEELFNVKELMDTPVRKLSLGERMKFELMAALIHEPEALFLDEPTIGLDLLAKKQMYHYINELNQEKGVTIIITTHNADDVENLCNHVVLMDEGRVIYDGQCDGLYCYDQSKKVMIRGEVKVDEEISHYIEKIEGNNYLFRCDKNDSSAVAAIVERTAKGSDISVVGMDIEDILLNIYGRKIEI